MPTTTLDSPDGFPSLAVEAGQIHLRLSENEVVIRKHGVEFLSTRPVPLWAEVTVDLRSPLSERPLRANGVVVDCTGSPHTGYTISVLFLDLPLESRDHLHELALASAT
jgi:hypothetical protein